MSIPCVRTVKHFYLGTGNKVTCAENIQVCYTIQLLESDEHPFRIQIVGVRIVLNNKNGSQFETDEFIYTKSAYLFEFVEASGHAKCSPITAVAGSAQFRFV